MARYSDTIRDERTCAPVSGAQVFVRYQDGTTPVITDDAGEIIPYATSDEYGVYAFNAPNTVYDLSIYLNGRLIEKLFGITVGTPVYPPASIPDGSINAAKISNDSGQQKAIADKIGVGKLIGQTDYGPVGTGVTENISRESLIQFTPAGASQADDVKWLARYTGTGDATEVRPFQQLSEYYHDGNVLIAYGQQGYIRVGVDGTKNSNVTSLRGIEYHLANEGNGTVATAQVFQVGDIDFRGIGFTTGTGTINKLYGFRTNNLQGQGDDAGRVVVESISFQSDDISEGAGLTASFRSEMTGGTNKYAFASTQGGPSSLQGKLRVGEFGTPTDQFEVMNGFLKASTINAYIAPGGFHELTSDRTDFSAYIFNINASTPNGLGVRFPNAAPNNTAQMFFRGQDSSGTKIVIWSNGNIVNTNNSYGAISDAKLKRDITDARPQIPDIRALKLRNYKLISDGENAREQLGLIAQEVLEVSPHLVSASPDPENPGETILGVNYSILYLKSVKALQEMLDLVDTLSMRIAALEEAT